MSQRTDTILACLYLATLRALLARPFARRQAGIAIGLGVLTFGAKELAVTLPAAALLLVSCLPRDEDRRRRWWAAGALVAVAAVYVVFWAWLFPGKLAGRAALSAGWGSFDPHALDHWLRALPALYGPLVLPTGYRHWWTTYLPGWSPAYLAAVAAVVVALAWMVIGGPDRTLRRLGILAVAWPVVLVLPLLGLRGIDLYRGGLIIALGAGWLALLVAHRLRRGWLPAVLAGALAFALTPITTDAAAAWGPGGFYRSMTQRHIRQMPAWLATLQPHCRDAFHAQVVRDAHMGHAP